MSASLLQNKPPHGIILRLPYLYKRFDHGKGDVSDDLQLLQSGIKALGTDMDALADTVERAKKVSPGAPGLVPQDILESLITLAHKGGQPSPADLS